MRTVLVIVSIGILVSCLPPLAHAAARIGIEGGVNAARLLESGSSLASANDWRFGYSAGAVLVVSWRPSMSLVTGIRYDRKGGRAQEQPVTWAVQAGGISDARGTLRHRLTLHYITVPLVLRLSAPSKDVHPAFEVGPEIGFLAGGNERYETWTSSGVAWRERDVASRLRLADLGLRVGIAILIPQGSRMSFIRVGYTGSITNNHSGNMDDPMGMGTHSSTAYNNAASLTAGYLF